MWMSQAELHLTFFKNGGQLWDDREHVCAPKTIDILGKLNKSHDQLTLFLFRIDLSTQAWLQQTSSDIPHKPAASMIVPNRNAGGLKPAQRQLLQRTRQNL